MRATVWVQPTSTEFRTAGVLVSREYILTSNRGIGSAKFVGVAFPIRDNDKWTVEASAYRDSIAVSEKGAWGWAEVVARDPDRDLALLRLHSDPPDRAKPLKLAWKEPAVGDRVHTMNHSGGVEFAWVYASGAVRQRGKVALAEGGNPVRIEANLLQIPAQAASPGGPVVNEGGELVGIVAAKESAQQTGYAASRTELAHFLDLRRNDLPAQSLEALLMRLDGKRRGLATPLAWALDAMSKGRDERLLRLVLELEPTTLSVESFCRLLDGSGRSAEADAELDRAVERFGYPALHLLRAERQIRARNWRAALGDLQALIAVHPAEGAAHRLRIRVLLELKKDDEAAAAVGDAVRCHRSGIQTLIRDLIDHADDLGKKFPDSPSVPANWLKLAIGAGARHDPGAERRKQCEVALKAAAAAEDDTARLRILREFLRSMN